eukprot:8572958-Karenia_brevis.AAC.1
MADNEVSEDIHAVLFAGGFDRLSTLMGLGETRAEVRDTLRDDFSIDASESLSFRVQVARLLATWDAARLQ